MGGWLVNCVAAGQGVGLVSEVSVQSIAVAIVTLGKLSFVSD